MSVQTVRFHTTPQKIPKVIDDDPLRRSCTVVSRYSE